MKKDEMIYLIEQYLLHEFFHGRPLDTNGGWDSYKSAENILTVIETSGMLPPKRRSSIDEIENQHDFYINEWEPE